MFENIQIVCHDVLYIEMNEIYDRNRAPYVTTSMLI